ncbi:MAG: hypothetical protein KDC33_10985 [Thermoleophilia bacterium]|nr:hypothetical protein [Thermoleophilia bacterium]
MRTALIALTASVALGAGSAALAPASAVPASKAGPGTAFTAWGTGKAPAWRAVVSKGRLRVESPSLGTFTVRVSRSAFSRGVDFTGRRKGRDVGLTVTSGACRHNGRNTGMRAKLTVGTRTVRGCAVTGVTPIADT